MKKVLGRLVAVALTLVACGDPPVADDAGPVDAAEICLVDEDCDDGTFCNGVERCQPANDLADGRGCVNVVEAPCALPAQSCDESMDRCTTECDISPDADGDGAAATDCGGLDCDDGDPLRHPGATEVCDADDRDEDCDPRTYGARDADRDTHDDALCCNVATDGTRSCGDDCDDFAASVSPVGTEVCNGRDDDCDGAVDDGVLVSGFRDADGDQHGDPATPIDACPGATRFSTTDDDCDDTNNRVHAAQVEVCDALDNDCDGTVDERTRAVTWYRDEDRDGFGSAAGGTLISCEPPDGYELLPIDCDDTRAGVSPIALEACNGRDDDCNGEADFVIAPGDAEDDDADGFVDVGCGGLGDDCDDSDASVHPGGEPYCDGRDHDCDGVVDVGAPLSWWRDEDGDGFGAGTPMESCEPPVGYVRRDGDCDDSLPHRSPAELDDCDGIDDDCDAEIDEGSTRLAFYADADGDGAGGGAPVLACAQPAGYGLYPTDCDDSDRLRYEGAVEICDGIDNDCDGTPDEATDTVCGLPGVATGTCSAGECTIVSCATGFADCNGAREDGCEIDTRADVTHCGSCANACATGPMSTTTCAAGSCVLGCDGGAADCDGVASTGCESVLAEDPENCGACGRRCAPREHARATCAASACGIECEAGWTDCDSDPATGCEVHTDADVASCGACGNACPLAGDACVRGMCVSIPFESTGAEGAFMPTVDTVLDPGVHHFTTIHVPAGVTVTTRGRGVLELRATGDVVIEGTIDLSGGAGFQDCSRGAIGGETGNPTPGRSRGTCAATESAGGGEGGVGTTGSEPTCCPNGGSFGGGNGGCQGGGGGGYAGGAGGRYGGVGASVLPGSQGGTGFTTDGAGHGGARSLVGGPLATYAGRDGCVQGNYTGGGGSIGEDAAMDLPMSSTFRPGSGGGGAGRGLATCGGQPSGSGGGGGGALRITSPTRITMAAGSAVLANGGAGVGGGGGGSGGAIHLVAPELDLRGRVSAVGGDAGLNPTASGDCTLGSATGDGGLGRIRLSVLPERCTLFGAFSPAIPATGCARTPPPGTPGRVYIDTYPF